MKEIRDIIAAFRLAEKAGKRTALATVVQLNGSSYRRPGARMLVTEDGEMTGAISGGCLEGDALRKALLAIEQQQTKLVTYDTSDEDDISIGLQLGCAGVIDVLFEPIDPSSPLNPLALLEKLVTRRQNAILVCLFSPAEKWKPQPGTCLLVEADGSATGEIPYPALEAGILADIAAVKQSGLSAFKNYPVQDSSVTAFIEWLRPPVSLIVVGAGNDAIPLVKMADTMGWVTTVVDGRPTHARSERFTAGCQVLVSKPEAVLEQVDMDDQTVFVLMTHNYQYDLAMLKALLQKKARYIGLLGPRKKLDKMTGDLEAEGISLSQEELNTIFGPVGLELGAETSEEIALSIAAEIKAVLAGKTGGFLREKNRPIHSRPEDGRTNHPNTIS